MTIRFYNPTDDASYVAPQPALAPTQGGGLAQASAARSAVGDQNWTRLQQSVRDALTADQNFAQKLDWSRGLSDQFDRSTLQGIDLSSGQNIDVVAGLRPGDYGSMFNPLPNGMITGWGSGNQVQPIGPMLDDGDDRWIDGWRDRVLPNAIYDGTYGLMAPGAVANPLRKQKGNFFFDQVLPMATMALLSYGAGAAGGAALGGATGSSMGTLAGKTLGSLAMKGVTTGDFSVSPLSLAGTALGFGGEAGWIDPDLASAARGGLGLYSATKTKNPITAARAAVDIGRAVV